MSTLLNDARYGFRMLLRSPGFAIVAVLTLALGIGANTALFSIVYGVLFRPLPYPQADRVAMVYMHFFPQNAERGTLSLADFLDWKANNHAFEEPSLFSNRRLDLTGVDQPEQLSTALVTTGFFPTLQVKPLLGRVFLPGEDAGNSQPVALLSENLWRRRFAADRNVIGQTINLGGRQTIVVGVMPADFHFPRQDTEVWANLQIVPPTRRGPFFYRGIARLKPGVSLQQAQAETNAIGRQIEQANKSYSRLTLPVVPLRESIVGKVRPALLLMFGAVFMVLLIATVNVANLVLARATSRQREIAVRLGLGASQSRIIRQLLTESTLLAAIGGVAGIAVAYSGIQLLHAWNPANLPRIADVQLDSHVLAFTLLVSLLTGILFGLAPALHSARGDISSALKEGGRSGTAGASRRRTHGSLVIAEMALSLTLLVAAGLLLRSFLRLQSVDAGFQAPPERVLAFDISASGKAYSDPRKVVAFYDQLLQHVRTLPGVESAAVGDSLPPDRQADADTFVIQGLPDQNNPAITHAEASPDYFRALGIPLLKGRYFTEADTFDSPRVVIISESMARRFFAGRDPIGMRIKQSGPELSQLPYMEIVGVVRDVKYVGLDTDMGVAAYYMPFTQDSSPAALLLLRSATSPENLVPAVRREVQALDRDVVVSNVTTMEQEMFNSVAQPRFRTQLLVLFAGMAVLMAAIGIYGVMAYSVVQRTQEIGVRMALGAQRGDVLKLVLAEGLRLAMIGVAVGLVAALFLVRLVSSLLFGIGATDPASFAAAALGLVAVAALACYIPARRAMAVDPMVALRYE